jgi:hypothetical protein
VTTRIAAPTYLAFPLALVLSTSCGSIGGEPGSSIGGRASGSGGRTGAGGGVDEGGATGAGGGGAAGGQPGSGGLGTGGNAGRGGVTAGAGGASTSGGSAGSDAGAGGRGGGPGGSSARDAGQGGARTTDAGPVACDDIESPGRLAVYYFDNSEVRGSSIQMNFDIVNYTAFTSRLSQVTVRYWFTDEDTSSPNVVEQYYVPIPTTMKFIPLNPPRTGANIALEMSFRDAPDSGASWVETRGFNFAFHKNSYAGTYDQSNDYSYDPKLTKTLGPNPKITAYLNGALAWGCEPPVQPAVLDAGSGEIDSSAGADVASPGAADVPVGTPDAGRRG